MIDIDLGGFLTNFGILISIAALVISFAVNKFIFGSSYLKALIVSIVISVIVFFASPAVFLVVMQVNGYSY